MGENTIARKTHAGMWGRPFAPTVILVFGSTVACSVGGVCSDKWNPEDSGEIHNKMIGGIWTTLGLCHLLTIDFQ